MKKGFKKFEKMYAVSKKLSLDVILNFIKTRPAFSKLWYFLNFIIFFLNFLSFMHFKRFHSKCCQKFRKNLKIFLTIPRNPPMQAKNVTMIGQGISEM